ncbi:hypothetical protein ACC734_38935, partial [Rhizobium ruizarguesonis]
DDEQPRNTTNDDAISIDQLLNHGDHLPAQDSQWGGNNETQRHSDKTDRDRDGTSPQQSKGPSSLHWFQDDYTIPCKK